MKRKEKILVIEDDESIRDLITDHLKLEGFTVVSVLSVEDAKKYLEIMTFDLIISDIVLPGKTGLDFLNEIENFELYGKIPVILVSARSSLDDIRIGMGLGADDYLTKPFRIDDLLNSINLRLKKRNLNSELYYIFDSFSTFEKYGLKHDDILFIEASNQYTVFRLSNGSVKTLSRSLKFWEEKLNKKTFPRINRSVIINIQKISYYQNMPNELKIKLESVESLFSVSRRRRKELLLLLKTLQIDTK